SLLFSTLDEKNRQTIVTCDLPACANRRNLTAQNRGLFRWMPSGREIAYVDSNSPSNVWVLPHDGNPPRQLTHFTDDRMIADIAWSNDGKRLAIVREAVTNDIVLFTGLKK